MSSGNFCDVSALKVALHMFMGFLLRGHRADRSWMPAARAISNISDWHLLPKPREACELCRSWLVVQGHDIYLVVLS